MLSYIKQFEENIGTSQPPQDYDEEEDDKAFEAWYRGDTDSSKASGASKEMAAADRLEENARIERGRAAALAALIAIDAANAAAKDAAAKDSAAKDSVVGT